MLAEHIPEYSSQQYKDAPSIPQNHINVVEFRPRRVRNEALDIELGERVVSQLFTAEADTNNHTNDEVMRGVALDRRTAAAKEHEAAIEAARRANEAIDEFTD